MLRSFRFLLWAFLLAIASSPHPARAQSRVPFVPPLVPRVSNPQPMAGAPVLETPTPVVPPPTFAPTPRPTPIAPPQIEAFLKSSPHPMVVAGRTLVPLSFFSDNLGASVGRVQGARYQLLYFGTQLDFWVGQRAARVNGRAISLPVRPRASGGHVWVPLLPFCYALGVEIRATDKSFVFLARYGAAQILGVRSTVRGDRVRTVITLSNPTRITATIGRSGARFHFAGARQSGIPETQHVRDTLVTQTQMKSGNWNADFSLRMNYAAPIQWFSLGFPARIVIDSQRLFEETSTQREAGLSLTRIRRGTGHGPVQMWAVKLDPRDGWRVRVEPAGYSVMQRARPSRLAARARAVVAINGGFFAYDGAAVGAMLINGEWIRLPWGGRTAVGFDEQGRAHIGNLQTLALAHFGSGAKLPVRDLNGWPDKGHITALTRHFGAFYRLAPGEMAVVIVGGINQGGKVVSRPGGGGVAIPDNGFALVASGAARPFLERIALGERASLSVQPLGWPHISTALGGGPRLLRAGKIDIPIENFKPDVTGGTGPRTAFGIDKSGRYILLIADGRQGFYSTGLTLQELAATMQHLGAVEAMNLDGGGSTAMAVRGKIINRPSDGTERSVSNALLVMR